MHGSGCVFGTGGWGSYEEESEHVAKQIGTIMRYESGRFIIWRSFAKKVKIRGISV